MKQVLQNLKNGCTELSEVPTPRAAHGQLLIHTTRSLLSAGTERMLVEFGKAGWLDRARQQPDKVRQVLSKIAADGLLSTVAAVRDKLDQPVAMGYCNAGVVVEIGSGVAGFAIGDRIASNGKHAEAVSVPANLCAKIPDNVTDDQAAFTVLGAIALQGIRLARPTLGECVVVTGLGLIGLIAVQLLRAQGCRVLGLDYNKERLKLAQQFGAEVADLSSGADPVSVAHALSLGRGVDAVLITAASRSSEPIHQAAKMSRKRGRIVLVGVTGLELSRADFYEKELIFQVSCSYGPGRYDPNYENNGQDYPFGFVRWTAQRNFEAVLQVMAEGRLDVMPLISHRFALERATEAYDLICRDEPSLGVLVEYPARLEKSDAILFKRTIEVAARVGNRGTATLGFIGAGNYATRVLMPAFRRAGAQLKSVASAGGVNGLHAARKFGFENTTTDVAEMLSDPEINAVVIATRHDTHADLTCRALSAGKHVFVEKPLAIQRGELRLIAEAYEEAVKGGHAPTLMVGFNRRFAPQVQKMKTLLEGLPEKKAFLMTVNAGAIPREHWARDTLVGGGRIVGEACHFIDLVRFLAAAPITACHTTRLNTGDDSAIISLSFADGSAATVNYLANGNRAFPKERLEVFGGGAVLRLDNFQKLTGYGWPRFRRMNLWRQDKGQQACAAAFTAAVSGTGQAPIPIEELWEVSEATLCAAGM